MSKKKERSVWFGAINHLNLDSDTPATDSKINDAVVKTPSASNVLADSKEELVEKPKAIVTTPSTPKETPPVPKENVPEVTPTVENVAPTQSSIKTKRKKYSKAKEANDKKPKYTSARVFDDLYEHILMTLPKLNKTEAMKEVMLFYLKHNGKKIEEARENFDRIANAYKKRT